MTTELQRVVETLGGRRVLRREIKNYRDFIVVLEKGLPYESLSSVVRVIGLKENELGRFFVESQRTLMRRARDKRFKPDESDRLARIARIIARATEALGSEEKATRWLQKPNRALGMQVPLSLLTTDMGARQVEDVLGRIEYGVYS